LVDASFEIMDAGGDCAPGPVTFGYERNSCCAGKPCIGMCVRINQGPERCWCMGIDGGCALDAGQVCCAGGFVTGCSAKNKACGLGL
jgi:hypothetical protein